MFGNQILVSKYIETAKKKYLYFCKNKNKIIYIFNICIFEKNVHAVKFKMFRLKFYIMQLKN